MRPTRRAIAVHLCTLVCLAVGVQPALADDWPHWLGPQRDSIWRERGILEKFPEQGPTIRWRTEIGAGYTSAAVAGGRVFLLDRPGSQTRGSPAGAVQRTKEDGRERVLCLDEKTGRVLWQHEYACPYNISYPSGPRAMPAVAGNHVYTLGAEGNLHCFDVATGRVVWSRSLTRDYGVETQTWGFNAAPLVDGDRVIVMVGGEGHTVVAFERETGREIWRALKAKEAGYSAPTIIEAGGKRQLIVWDSESLNSLDPATGAVFWSEPFKTKMAHAIGTPRRSGDFLLISSFFDGSMLMRLDAKEPRAAVAWQLKGRSETRPEGLHSLMSTPFIEDGYIYGVCSFGQLRCLKLETGERVWETLVPTSADGKPARWMTAFLVKHEDRFFIYNETGDLIIAKLSPQGYEEVSRAHLLEPTNMAGGRPVHWCHPAFANRSVYVRNDREIVCVNLSAPGAGGAAK